MGYNENDIYVSLILDSGEVASIGFAALMNSVTLFTLDVAGDIISGNSDSSTQDGEQEHSLASILPSVCTR